MEKKNYLDEIIDEVSIEYNIDRDKLQAFTNEFSNLIYKKTVVATKERENFELYVWGKITYNEGYHGKDYRKRNQVTFYKKKHVNNLFLHKLANELNYILSLYK